MKIRYYLRGLGLGVLVTAIFFMVSDNSSGTMSDEMIKARAKELGMTESVVLAELSTQEETTVPNTEETLTEENTTEASAVEENAEAVTTEEAETEETTVEETTVEEAVTEVMETEESSEEENIVEVSSGSDDETSKTEEKPESITPNTEPVSVMVNRGEGSDTVSKRLQEAGLVADAYEYDRYLMANGYDKRIGVGEHVIPAGATWEEIAKILCNMK